MVEKLEGTSETEILVGHKNESKKFNADKSNPQRKDSPKFTKQLAHSWPLHNQEVKITSSVK